MWIKVNGAYKLRNPNRKSILLRYMKYLFKCYNKYCTVNARLMHTWDIRILHFFYGYTCLMKYNLALTCTIECGLLELL